MGKATRRRRTRVVPVRRDVADYFATGTRESPKVRPVRHVAKHATVVTCWDPLLLQFARGEVAAGMHHFVCRGLSHMLFRVY
jgi:hypothetical protein